MQTIKALVFDMAGTTINEDNVVYKTLQNAINKAGIKVDLNTVLEHGAGKEKLNAVKDIMSHLSVDNSAYEVEAIHNVFLNDLDHAYQTMTIGTYPGVEELLFEFRDKGIKIVLNTGYNRKIAELLLNKMNWEKGKQYDLLVTASDVENSRPKPDMIEYAMSELKMDDPGEVAKIGDSIIDIEEGKNAGCGLTIGVTTGAHTKEQLMSINPDYILENLSELRDIIGAPIGVN